MPYTVPDDDALDLFAIVQAGVKSKRLQSAYHYEREEVQLVAILKDQIAYGEDVLTALEHTCKLPSRTEMTEILKGIKKHGKNIPKDPT